MDVDDFSRYLKKRGKKAHVILGLVRQVEEYEQYLFSVRGKTLDSSDKEDIFAYIAEMDKENSGTARKNIRGPGLYYRYIGRDDLAQIFSGLREERIAKYRRSFVLRDFRGIPAKYTKLLEDNGIINIDAMLDRGANADSRRLLARQTGIPMPVILELVKLSDLARIDGVKAIRARLYHDAGVDTVEKMAAQDPEKLLQLTADFVKRTGFKGIPPLPMEVQHTIEAAKNMPRIVNYD